MPILDLPAPHALRARWMPLQFYPKVGSRDCITVAIIAVDEAGKFSILKANNLAALFCFFGEGAQAHINFIDMAVNCLQEEVTNKGREFFDAPLTLGSSFSLGSPSLGSGNSLDAIAAAWLGKISIVHANQPLAGREEHSTSLMVFDQASVPAQQREKKIVPAVRDEIAGIAPQFSLNFNKEFTFKDRSVPVKLNYSGTHLVAGFDRVSPRSIGNSLEKVRSKLWVLAEHRDQTLHEAPRLHEMLVVPSTIQDAIIRADELRSVTEACGDIEKEADRRKIRFRLFQSPREVATHIMRVESGAAPAYMH